MNHDRLCVAEKIIAPRVDLIKWDPKRRHIRRPNNNDNNNGDLNSALTAISTTRFTIAAYRIKLLIKRDSITRPTKYVMVTTLLKYMPSTNSHITLYIRRNPLSTRYKHRYDWISARTHRHIHTYRHRQTDRHTRTYIYTHTQTGTHARTHARMHTHIHMHARTHPCTHTHTHTHTHTCARMHACAHTYKKNTRARAHTPTHTQTQTRARAR